MKKQLMLACLAFCLAFSSHSMAAEKNGWRSEAGGSVYYVKGTKAKGLKTIGSYTYYFKKEDGTLLKNRWLRYKGKYYYFQNRGRMVTGRWVGKNYYVGKDGARVTNQWVGKKFLGEDGRWIKGFKGGWQKIKGKWYYYTSKGKKRRAGSPIRTIATIWIRMVSVSHSLPRSTKNTISLTKRGSFRKAPG